MNGTDGVCKMVKIQITKVITSIDLTERLEVTCGICGKITEFYYVCPSNCKECDAPLPNVVALMSYKHVRVKYHRCGEIAGIISRVWKE